MRILKVVQAYFPFQDLGGPVVKVRGLARALAARGHQITVLTVDHGIEPYVSSLPQMDRSEWGRRLEEDGVTAIYVPSVARYRAATWNPKAAGYARTLIGSFDVAHFYGLYDLLGPSVSRFCRRGRVPYFVEPMGMYQPIDRSLRLKLLWRRTFGAAFLCGATFYVATSEIEQQELVEGGLPASKVLLRYNGIDLSAYDALPPRSTFRAKWKIAVEEPVVLFLSRLIPRKGADVLIDAFAKACPHSGRLVIAGPEGEAGYGSYLEDCAQKAGVAERVIIAGALYDEDKRAAFADSDVFALPSRYENFANVAAEAMACGVPVIVSRACGIAPLVEGCAGLVIDANREGLAAALRTILGDSALRARLGEGGRRVVQQLTWTHLAAEMEEHYQNAVAAGFSGR